MTLLDIARPGKWLRLAPLLLLAGCAATPHEHAGAPQAALRIALSGDIARPAVMTADDLEKLPRQSQTVSYATGRGPQTRSYEGASLWSVLDAAGIRTDPGKKGDLQTKYIVVTAADGYRVVFSLGELKPDLGGRASLIAYTEGRDGIPAPTSKITSPGDTKGGRYVAVPTDIEVRASGSARRSTGGGYARTVTISGAVQRPGTFDLAALKAMPAVTAQVGANRYTGVDLWYLLDTVAGIQAPDGAKDPNLVRYVVATASDGYQALFSLGELDPAFGGKPGVLAYAIDGSPLDRSGYARLLAPADEKPGRSIANLVDLEVFVAPPAR